MQNSIEGWLLNNPDEALFLLDDTGEEYGFCVSDTCAHNSHDPRGPVMKLSLRHGEMELTGTRRDWGMQDPQYEEYYHLPDDRYLKVTKPYHYGAFAELVTEAPSLPKESDDPYDPAYHVEGEEVKLPRVSQEKRPPRPAFSTRPRRERPQFGV